MIALVALLALFGGTAHRAAAVSCDPIEPGPLECPDLTLADFTVTLSSDGLTVVLRASVKNVGGGRSSETLVRASVADATAVRRKIPQLPARDQTTVTVSVTLSPETVDSLTLDAKIAALPPLAVLRVDPRDAVDEWDEANTTPWAGGFCPSWRWSRSSRRWCRQRRAVDRTVETEGPAGCAGLPPGGPEQPVSQRRLPLSPPTLGSSATRWCR